MLESVGFLILGLVVLVVGGEFLVKGAVGISLKLKVSTLVIGLTVVSFGTSAPELLVSINAALDGKSAIAIGNVIGSNIANLALVLGATCLVYPIAVRRQTLRFDWPVMMIASVILFAFMIGGRLVFWEGLVLFLLLIGFNIWTIRSSRRAEAEEDFSDDKNVWIYIGFLIAGCLGLVYGSDWMLEGAVGIAEYFEIPDSVIGATVIAFGTSVPELATSLVAAFRKQTDISIGNLIGSNIFNILCILGITPMIQTVEFDTAVLSNEMIWMLVISFAILPLSLKTYRISRLKGAILMLTYIAFCYFVI